MKKDLFNLRLKSKLLLFSLFALLAGGVSPAWAEAYTETFTSGTNGWKYANDVLTLGTDWGTNGSLSSFALSSTYRNGSTGTGLANTNSNSDVFIITPKLAKGTITLYAKGTGSTMGNGNKVYLYTCDANGSNRTAITNTTAYGGYTTVNGDGALNTTMRQFSYTLTSDSHIAILIGKAAIDDFEASNGLAPIPNKAVDITAFSTTTPSVSANSESKYNASFSVTVKNDGLQDIVAADNVTVSLLNASDEVIATSEAIEITKAEGSKVVTLDYEGTSTTDQTVTFKVKDNFSDKTFATTAEVAVTAYGARFAIDNTSANFGLLELNATCTPQTFEITNSGNSDLVITVGETGDAYAYKTLLFTNDKGWSDVYLYAWNNEGDLTAAFPGNKQTATGYANEYNQPLYALFVPKGATKIIVSKGNGGNGNQSADIDMDYTKTGLFLDNNYAGVFYGDGDLLVRANSKTILAVGMTTATVGAKSGSIELTYTAINGSSSTVSASGVVMPAGANVVDFNDNQLPNRWTNINTYWSFANGKATGKSSSSGLITPKLTFSSGDFIVIKARRFDSGTSDYLTVKGSSDNGSTWTAYEKKLQEADGLTYPDWSYIVLSDIPTAVNKLWFVGYYAEIDEIIGLNYDQNDPEMGIYSDVECTAANMITDASVNVDFGFATTTAPNPAVYYFKNDGTGTMELTKGADPAGLTVTLDKTSVAAGEHATLTIAMPVENNGGYHGGDVVVTATNLGSFTVKAQGVVEEDDKLNLNFATDAIPATWNAGQWMKDNEGYIKTGEYGYSTTSMETTKLVAEAGEKLVVIAKNGSTTTSYKFGIKYKNADDPDAVWADLIPYTNQGTSWKTLVATITDAGNYLLQFTGYNAQIQRIYGLSKPDEPEMVVYDGTSAAGASHSFGKVTDENDATWTLTVKNEGEAALTGLAVALTGDNADHYTAVIADNKTELAKDETATITVTQLKSNLGTHSATLTISATGLDSKVIALSGETVDHTLLNIDFATAGVWPAEIIQHGNNWNVNYGTANQTSSTASSSMIISPLTVAATTDKFNFKVQYYSSTYSKNRDLTIRYTIDGGLTWTPYNWGTELEPVTSLKSQITSGLKNFEITNIPAGTVAFDFYGQYISVDDITGDMKVAQAPLVTFKETANNINGANLKADATATYTLANNGNADYVATVATTNVTAEVTGDGVTFASNTLTVPAGKTATITVTMPFPNAAPYGEKTGKLKITDESWVADIEADYTANLVDPTNFVEDFAAGKPAGWYNGGWTISGGDAHIWTGTAKELITEKLGVDTGKDVLTFDAKVNNGSDEQTLNVYTSTDRKTWSSAQTFTLTSAVQSFSLTALAADSYVKFEASNASIDNLTGVKKLTAPAHDLYEVSNEMAATGIPGASYTATVVGVSLRANETVTAELWLKKGGNSQMVASLTNEAMTVDVNKTFELTGNLPNEEGEYKMWVTVKNSLSGDDYAYFNTDEIDFTLAHTTFMTINDFEVAVSPVQADNNNRFVGTYNVTVKNTGSKTLAADEISISLINDKIGRTTAASSFVFVTPGAYTGDDAVIAIWNWSDETDGEWVLPTNMGTGLYTAELMEGKQDFSVVRLKPSTSDGYDTENGGINWNNKWNESEILTTKTGNNVFEFESWGSPKDNFNKAAYTLAADETVVLPVYVTGTLTDGENGTFAAKAEENIGHTQYGNGLTCTLSVTAAPVIELDETVGTIASTGSNRKVTLNRTFVKGWNTICLPFAIAATDIDEDAKALKFSEYNSSTKELTFSPVTELEANKPYVIYVPSVITKAIEFTGKTVTSSNELGVTSNGVTFQGTYAPINDGSLEGKWGLTAAGKIAKASATTTMKGFRAYFDGIPTTGAGVRFLDDLTGISTITADGVAVEGVYNLQGQKVEQLKKGGLYIINGKKTLVK